MRCPPDFILQGFIINSAHGLFNPCALVSAEIAGFRHFGTLFLGARPWQSPFAQQDISDPERLEFGQEFPLQELQLMQPDRRIDMNGQSPVRKIHRECMQDERF